MGRATLKKIDLLQLLLRPVVRFALRHGIRFQETLQMLKLCFIEEAESSLLRTNQKVNKSRLSVITGLQRKDLEKLESFSDDSLKTNLVSKILGNWSLSPDYCQKNGKPKRLNCEGAESEFVALVRSVSSDLHPGTVMFELERMKLVERKDGKVTLLSRVMPLGDKPQETYSLVADNTDDLLHAVEENLFDQRIVSKERLPNLHASTEFTRIAPEKADAIREWLLIEGSRLHKKTRDFLAEHDLDLHPKEGSETERGVRVALSTFSYITAEDK